MSMAAENTTVLSASSDTRWVIDEPTAASGSGLAAAAGQEHLYVLYSSEGNDITFATGSNDGTWQTESLPIPVD